MGFLVFDVGLLRQHPVRVRFGSVLPVKPANFETIAALPNLSSEKEKTLSNEKTVCSVEVCFFAVDLTLLALQSRRVSAARITLFCRLSERANASALAAPAGPLPEAPASSVPVKSDVLRGGRRRETRPHKHRAHRIGTKGERTTSRRLRPV